MDKYLLNYCELKLNDFINGYQVALVENVDNIIRESESDLDYLLDNRHDYEKKFLLEILNILDKKANCFAVGGSLKLDDVDFELSKKQIFIFHKLLNLGYSTLRENNSLIENKVGISKSKNTFKPTINGVYLNLKDRYLIASRVFNLDKIMSQIDAAATIKYQLLSIILGCHTDNAKDLLNNKLDGKVHDEAIDYFLNQINQLKKG